MAECKVITSKTVVLRLTEKEAIFIAELCQNTLSVGFEETPENREIRTAIFTALHEQKIQVR